MKNNSSVIGVIGPGSNPNETELKMPKCIKVETPEDKEELRQFIDDIVAIANKRALNLFAEMMITHNETITAFTKKLGA